MPTMPNNQPITEANPDLEMIANELVEFADIARMNGHPEREARLRECVRILRGGIAKNATVQWDEIARDIFVRLYCDPNSGQVEDILKAAFNAADGFIAEKRRRENQK